MQTTKIKQALQEVILEIGKKLEQEPKRDVSEYKVELGEAPEYFETFGVVREKNKLIFGSWLNDLPGKNPKNYLWEGLIVREGLTLFLDEELLTGEQKQLTDLMLNVFAIVFITNRKQSSSSDVQTSPIRNRAFYGEEANGLERIIVQKFGALLQDLLKQHITVKFLLHTYTHFVTDIYEDEFSLMEILDDITRYVTVSAEQITAPIYLKPKIALILKELIQEGFKTSGLQLSKKLGIVQSTISRQIALLSSRYYAKWRTRKNWKKMGLHYHLGFIQTPLEIEQKLEGLVQELQKVPYISFIFTGRGSDNQHIYFTMACPYIVADSLTNKLEKLEKNGQINGFSIIPVLKSENYLSFTDEKFQPSLTNYEKLLKGKHVVEQVKTHSIEFSNEIAPMKFDEKDYNLLHFMSCIKSKTLGSGTYGVWFEELTEKFKERGYDAENIPKFLIYINKLQNRAIEEELLDYHMMITLSSFTKNRLLIRFFLDPEDERVQELVEKFTVFGSVYVIYSYYEVTFSIVGPSFDSPLTALLLDEVAKFEIPFDYCILSCKVWRHVPLVDLYDFESKKWLLK